MDSATHILSGVIIHQSLTKKYRSTFLLLLSIVIANFPDIDFVFTFFTRDSIVFGHRAITHALIVAPFFAFCFALFFYKQKIQNVQNSPWTFTKIFLYSLFILLIHLYLDLITTYGMYVLLPFSLERYSVPSIFIMDPFLLSGLILSLFFSRKFGTKATRTGLAFLFLYPIFSYGIQITLEQNMTKKYAPLLGKNVIIDLVPMPLSPIYWKVIIDEGNKLHMGEVNIFNLAAMPQLQTFDKVDPTLWSALQSTNTTLKKYTQLAIYPAMLVEEKGDFEIITITPLPYTPSSTTPDFAKHDLFTMKIQKKGDSIIAYRRRKTFLNENSKWIFLPAKESTSK
ncbi:MAG: metal-dependent hydrolase [Desulfovibrionaceae bacterium]